MPKRSPTLPRALILFARAPEAGQVKTRLAREVGEAQALSAYLDLGALALAAVAPLVDCERIVAYTPPDQEALVRKWLPGAHRYEAQAEGDLGERMLAALASGFARGAGKVLLIGTDCPGLGVGLVEAAFAALDRADAVFGPARDGGYYLVGMTRAIPELFDGVPWSTPRALAATLERAAAAGVTVVLLDERRDVDTAADWRAWLEARNAPPGN